MNIENNDENVSGAGFDSKGIGLKAQKKLLGKMSGRKIAKHFIDDTTGRLLDRVFQIAKGYKGKKDAEKLLKNVIKIVVKIGILYRNDQFNEAELTIANNFRKKFHHLAMTITSFVEVDFSYERNYLIQLIHECRAMLDSLIERHLTDKSKGRVEFVFTMLQDPDLLDTVFKADGPFREIMKEIMVDLHQMMDDGTI